MTASNVRRGRTLEYTVREKLKANGYVVFRCAGSRPVDLVAFKDKRVLLVECKAGLNPYLSPKQSNHILEISKNEATPILVVRRRHKGIRWFKMNEHRVEEIKLKDLNSGNI